MDLGTMANIAEVIGMIVVVGGLGFGLVQLQQLRIQRRATAAIELARFFHDAEFVRALRLVLSLPEETDAETLRAEGSEMEDAALLVSLTVEAIAVMVHRRMISLHLVWELMGGVLLEAWQRLEGWTREVREETGEPKLNEWTQWLAEQLRTHEARCHPEPAYVRHRAWKPRGDAARFD